MDHVPCSTVIKDNNGNRWILLVSDSNRKWERLSNKFPYCHIETKCLVSSENYQVYEIHDNGGRPFDVVVSPDKIFIFSNNCEESQHILTLIDYRNIFIGKDTGIQGEYGNTILIQTKEGNYIYIGSQIESFHTESPILEYYSPLGGNDVPYPYAVTQDNVYLILDHVVIKKNGLVMYSTYENMGRLERDPYEEYYNKKIDSNPFTFDIIVPRSNSTLSLFNIWKAATAPYRV